MPFTCVHSLHPHYGSIILEQSQKISIISKSPTIFFVLFVNCCQMTSEQLTWQLLALSVSVLALKRRIEIMQSGVQQIFTQRANNYHSFNFYLDTKSYRMISNYLYFYDKEHKFQISSHLSQLHSSLPSASDGRYQQFWVRYDIDFLSLKIFSIFSIFPN